MSKIDFKTQHIPFTQVANDVLNDPKLSLKSKGLYAFLYSKPDGWNFEANRISKQSKDGRDSVRGAIKELEDNGYLEREKLSDGRMIYRIVYKPMTENPLQAIENPMTEKPNDGKTHSGKTRHISNKEIKVIKSISNKEICAFDLFWESYPVKRARKPAQMKWDRLDHSTRIIILEDIQNRKEKDVQWISGFIPHPTTYLNQERWNDEITSKIDKGHKIYVAE